MSILNIVKTADLIYITKEIYFLDYVVQQQYAVSLHTVILWLNASFLWERDYNSVNVKWRPVEG
jgi:hypothetical protein